MLPFFTNPYPDELIYSAIARYHFYSGNLDCKDTLEELFGSRSIIPSVAIGSHFSALSEKLGPYYSIETLLANNTIYPYYASFLSNKRQKEIINDVAYDGKGLYTRLGIVAGGICRKNGLYYCTECAKNDVEKYGETYIHREHQLEGIDYCAHHENPLRKYKVDAASRIEYIRFEFVKMDFSPKYHLEKNNELSVQLAKKAYQLLQLPLHKLSRETITLKYRHLLREKNLVTPANRLKQYELYQSFQNVYPEAFLLKYESSLDIENEYNWLKVMTRNTKRHVHPFRHLLIMNFLSINVENLFEMMEDSGPFGNGPFPCLNKAAEHYKQRIIANVEVSRDFKSNAPIGTFKCNCGFVYARKGPDRSADNQFKIGRVKIFGDVWKRRLEELVEHNLSIRSIARKLGVDSKTIKRYLAEDVELNKQSPEINNQLMKQYKKDIGKAVDEFPNLKRTELRSKYKKQYMFLYRNDKKWLMNMLPSKKKKAGSNKTVDWVKRDSEYVAQIKKLHSELLQLEKLVRITLSLIGKRLGILANLERHLDKLPKTKKLLNSIIESVQQFQIRRCCKVIDQMLFGNEQVYLWKVQRIAAVKSHHFYEIKKYLENYVQKIEREDRASILRERLFKIKN